MKTTLIRFLNSLWLSAQLQLTRLAESSEDLLDAGLNQLAGKDHALNASFAPERSILSSRHTGFVISGYKRQALSQSYMGLLVNGGSGSGKSTIVGIPNCLTTEHSKIIHDPSGELFEASAAYLESQGYTIIRIDWTNAKHSHQFNPLKRANTLAQYSKLATQLIEATANAKEKGNFWQASAIGLLVTVFRIIKLLPVQYHTFREAAHIIDLLQGTGKKEVDRLVATICEQDAGLFDKYASLVGNSENVLASILATGANALKIYDTDEQLMQITSEDTLGDFKSWRKRKTAVYINSSTVNMRYFAPISSILFQQYFESLFSALPKDDELDMSFILDETPVLNIDLSTLAANVRKYRGMLAVFVQDAENQLANSFTRESARSILSNLKTKVYLTASLDTAQALSKELGNYQYQEKGSKHQKTRALMTVDELMNLQGKGLITVTNEKPVLAKLTPYYQIPALLKQTKLVSSIGDQSSSDESTLPPLLDIPSYLESLILNTTTHEPN